MLSATGYKEFYVMKIVGGELRIKETLSNGSEIGL